MAQLHVITYGYRRVDPLWASRQVLPPKRTTEISQPHRMAQIYLGFGIRYLSHRVHRNEFICTPQLQPSSSTTQQISLQPLRFLPCYSGEGFSRYQIWVFMFTVRFLSNVFRVPWNPLNTLTVSECSPCVVMHRLVCRPQFSYRLQEDCRLTKFTGMPISFNVFPMIRIA